MSTEKLTMNYIYCVGYYTMEESEKIMLTCKVKYYQEEFERLIARVSVDIVKEEQKKEHAYVKNFQDITDKVVNELIRVYGFKHFNVDATFRPFGWASIFDNKDWQSSRDDQLIMLTKAMNEAGFIKDE